MYRAIRKGGTFYKRQREDLALKRAMEKASKEKESSNTPPAKKCKFEGYVLRQNGMSQSTQERFFLREEFMIYNILLLKLPPLLIRSEKSR